MCIGSIGNIQKCFAVGGFKFDLTFNIQKVCIYINAISTFYTKCTISRNAASTEMPIKYFCRAISTNSNITIIIRYICFITEAVGNTF